MNSLVYFFESEVVFIIIRYFEKLDRDSELSLQVLSLLRKYDTSFFPPLSSRESSTQAKLDMFDYGIIRGNVLAYFNMMRKQGILIAFEGDTVCGFMSFIENYKSKIINKKLRPNVYVSTIIVDDDFRGHNITGTLYDYLRIRFEGDYILTRTWSLNDVHIHILNKKGFKGLHRILDDRGIGIDTVYFVQQP